MTIMALGITHVHTIKYVWMRLENMLNPNPNVKSDTNSEFQASSDQNNNALLL